MGLGLLRAAAAAAPRVGKGVGPAGRAGRRNMRAMGEMSEGTK